MPIALLQTDKAQHGIWVFLWKDDILVFEAPDKVLKKKAVLNVQICLNVNRMKTKMLGFHDWAAGVHWT